MSLFLCVLCVLCGYFSSSAQTPPIEPGVSHELAKWRAARYSDVRYKLNLTLEKMSPVLKGKMEIRVNLNGSPPYEGGVDAALGGRGGSLLILDWRKIRGSEHLSTVSAVTVNGRVALSGSPAENHPVGETPPPLLRKEGSPDAALTFTEINEHLIFRDGVVPGENVIKLDFTSPILTSGSAITRYVDKEDGAEYIYSLFVPSDASTAFPVFDQPDLKARFTLKVMAPDNWRVVSNESVKYQITSSPNSQNSKDSYGFEFGETKPISTYVFAFAAGPFERVGEPPASAGGFTRPTANATETKASSPTKSINANAQPPAYAGGSDLYVRKSQAAKFKAHAAEVFRLNREGIKYLEQYFDYKFPFPKYDLVLIPEFPFGGMEHAGATFLRESSIIFPQEPTKSDYISRANLIFHEAAHQWFGDTVTMKWFDDLWLKEGFAEFMAYKTLERVMPDANAWKVFYERNKQAAYLTDSTKGTTPIYQEIANLNSAKSAYGNIVYRKAPSFLKQAEFYLGPDKFQTAVRAFLKKYEYGNAGWEYLVKEFEDASKLELKNWAKQWVQTPGLPVIKTSDLRFGGGCFEFRLLQTPYSLEMGKWSMALKPLVRFDSGPSWNRDAPFTNGAYAYSVCDAGSTVELLFPNRQDYGYGIFLLDDKSRDYVLKNIGSEKDDFLRSMMWGSLWDSVREGELDPKEYVELAIKQLPTEKDETIVSSILGRVSTALNYYVSEKGEPPASAGGQTRPTTNSGKTMGANAKAQPPAYAGGSPLNARFEAVLLDRLQNAPTPGQRITFYRAFVANASTAKGREVLKEMLRQGSPKGEPPASAARLPQANTNSSGPKALKANAQPPANAGGSPLRTKDRFDIVQRLIILGDPDALKLLAELKKTEATDDAKRYAYAARAGIATAENKAKYWNDFVNNKEISESWIEAAFGSWNSIRHADLTLPYLERALKELPNHKRNRKIFFINGWLGAFIGGQRSEAALATVNKFLADNPTLDRDLRLKILENVDLIERAVKIRRKYGR